MPGLKPAWKGPFTGVLSISTAAKVAEVTISIHHSKVKLAPASFVCAPDPWTLCHHSLQSGQVEIPEDLEESEEDRAQRLQHCPYHSKRWPLHRPETWGANKTTTWCMKNILRALLPFAFIYCSDPLLSSHRRLAEVGPAKHTSDKRFCVGYVMSTSHKLESFWKKEPQVRKCPYQMPVGKPLMHIIDRWLTYEVWAHLRRCKTWVGHPGR